jgi:hypothetical protein
MRILATLALCWIASCGRHTPVLKTIDTEIFDDFRTVLKKGAFEELALRLHPDVLRTFRHRLEFTTSSPMEGSWFTGTRDHQPTQDELESTNDTDFFVRYMKGYESVMGIAFEQGWGEIEVVATTYGTEGYRHFIVTKDTAYGWPVTFTFAQIEGKWVLTSPSIVDNFANQYRAARGGMPEG